MHSIDDIKVLVGFPSGDHVHADFAACLASMVAYSTMQGIPVAIFNAKSCSVERNHFYMARKALDMGASHLMIIGTDMTFPAHALGTLLVANKDVVATNAAMRTPPHGGIAKDLDGEFISIKKGDPLVEASLVGTGVSLIKTDVFRKLAEPYFVNRYIGKGEFDSCDFDFCRSVRDAGMQIWCHRKLSKEIGHIGAMTHYIQ